MTTKLKKGDAVKNKSTGTQALLVEWQCGNFVQVRLADAKYAAWAKREIYQEDDAHHPCKSGYCE